MATVTLSIATDNAAFEDDPRAEVARILREAATKVLDTPHGFALRDLNGNTVGRLIWKDEEVTP